jgi:hypothetical protein
MASDRSPPADLRRHRPQRSGCPSAHPRRCQVPRLAPVQGSYLGYMGSLGGNFSEYAQHAQQCRRSPLGAP